MQAFYYSIPYVWIASTSILATYLVAKVENKVVGYIGMWFVMDECHITNIAVLR